MLLAAVYFWPTTVHEVSCSVLQRQANGPLQQSCLNGVDLRYSGVSMTRRNRSLNPPTQSYIFPVFFCSFSFLAPFFFQPFHQSPATHRLSLSHFENLFIVSSLPLPTTHNHSHHHHHPKIEPRQVQKQMGQVQPDPFLSSELS